MMKPFRWAPLALLLPLLSGCVGPMREADVAAATRTRSGALEVRVFQGGYGVDFYERAAREYEKSHPGVKIDLKGDPRIWEQLRPRFVAGEPPGLTFPGGGFDHYAHIYEHQVTPLDDALLTTPYGEASGTWRDSFIPEILKLGEYEGQTYLLPYYLSLNGWWYNVELFEKNGWTPPQTYDELLVLCEKIKAAGIAPLTHQGKYPYYALSGFVLPWAISIGGIKALRDAEGLTPGAWKAEPFVRAARMVDDLRKKGYFQNGSNGMSHTEAQMEFLQGRAAMIPCGTWLESEMKKQMPPGFRMAFFLPPRVSGGKGDPTTLQVGVEPWLVPTRGENGALAVDFFKYLTSKKKAREFVQEKGTLTAIQGTSDGELPPTLRRPAEALRQARVTWTTRYRSWYPSLEQAAQNATAALMQGSVTPEQFADQIEAAAEKVRKDPNIPKQQP
ncbi:MAG TPA: extracellular solute-binding protein [Armatimonadota bacterium]|nr:extracellular solute-binding protein [Armatimonadota bacterium]